MIKLNKIISTDIDSTAGFLVRKIKRMDTFLKKSLMCKKCKLPLIYKTTTRIYNNIDYVAVYICNKCKTTKLLPYLEFSLGVTISNYIDFSEKLNANVIRFYSGETISSKIQNKLKQNTNLNEEDVIKEVWMEWAKQNPLQFLDIIALTKKFYVYINDKYNIFRYLSDFIRNSDKYVNEYTLNTNKINFITKYRKTNIRIIDKELQKYCIRNAKCVIWLGYKTERETFIQNFCLKLNKKYICIDDLNKLITFEEDPNPLFITGDFSILPQIKLQVSDYLDRLNLVNNEIFKIRTVISTARTVVDRAILNWCIKKQVYVLLLNSKKGYIIGKKYHTVNNLTKLLDLIFQGEI